VKIEAAIFDLDGTLIDSVPAYLNILGIILKRLNLPPVSKEALSALMGGGRDAWEMLIPEELKHKRDEIRNEIIEIAKEAGRKIFPQEIKLIPGVSEIFNQLSSRQIKLGLVTSTHARALDVKLIPLQREGIDVLFDVVITFEDTPKAKPAPDPLIECARRLEVTREKSVYVGDSYVDIRAGKAAGMITIGVLTGMDDYETLKEEKPDVIVKSVFDLSDILM